MRVITTHINTDFDGLASLVAASKIYPDSIMLLPGRVNENVKEFVSLYKNVFPFKKLSQVDLDKVEELVIVDTQQASRLGLLTHHLDNIPRIIIYDHHGDGFEDAIENAERFVEKTGATVTILLEIIIRGNIKITPEEATLFALGLYEDTGCFTFSTTTQREIGVLKYLAEQGMDFNVIRNFIGRPLTEKQKYLLEFLMDNTEIHEFQGLRAAISLGEMEEEIRGLSFVSNRLMDIENVDLIILIVKMEDRIHLVGRCKTDRINLKKLFEPYDGGGHERAASAVVRDKGLQELKNSILGDISKKMKPAVIAMDIMSYPVRSISPKDTVEEAWSLLVTYGHSGLPITDKGKLVGIISRNDLEKARRHGLGHAPVKAYMSSKVETVRPDTPLKDMEEMMVNKDLGRLPVTDERGRILGIVTRTNVLKVRHHREGERVPTRGGREEELETLNDLNYLINNRLPKRIQGLLFLLGQKADHTNRKVFAVGGFVRDLILGRENYDIDLVVEPDAIEFAREMNRFLDGKLTAFDQFGTAKIVLRDGLRIDLATARMEFYAQPGALPQVELSNIKQDLYRRDFTINTLAFQLNVENFGNLLDFFGGLKDLRLGIIRVLYNLSFVEDPLRILRAIRFEQRFNFTIEEETMGFLKNAVKTRVINKVSRERVFEEISLIFQEENPLKILRRLQNLKLWSFLFPQAELNSGVVNLLEEVHKVTDYFIHELGMKGIKKSIPYLCAIYYFTPVERIPTLLYKMRAGREVKRTVRRTLEEAPRVVETLSVKGVRPSTVYELLEGFPIESMIFFSACANNLRVWGYIKEYLERLRNESPLITGRDLKEMGYEPGPIFKEALRELKKAKMDRKVKNRDDELKLVIKYMEEKREGD
ncbi:MAG: CBS domain-containing protein [Candidatus Syntrophonatronum acetioxidans]|uniref:CBS domain-containing protein n=1 Tax=Candidatus Syntrophonatronum acetioxidans TaxID=1795816 RepID=A0A424YFJ8_9FIRM|nr:MAG: CBS domain-containing protein [Candidatus Syntrophonatronum acetioxidans]